VCALALAFPGLAGAPLAAQTPGDTLTVAAGAHYEAGTVRRLLHGDNWRHVWVAPVRVPVLDIRTFAGGLEPLRAGGGNQTITLHMVDAQGRRWIFRSIDKRPGGSSVPPELHGTPAGAVIRDHVSMLHPGAYFLMPVLLEAVGVLHAQPMLFVMPDDPALGEYREAYAGMLGELERRPDEGPDDTPGFAGSRKIKSSENLFEDLESGHEHRVDERDLLRARLVDILVGDTDRGTDQWRWARYGEEGDYTWRPIPADRDWALVRADGLLARMADRYYEKLARFDDEYPSMETLTYSSHVIDRGLLTRLTRSDVMEQATRVQAALTDSVIDRAVAALPPEYAAVSGGGIASALRVRRDRLLSAAAGFYDWLATEVDVRGTDERDYAEVERRADGTVRVRIWPLREVTVPVASGGRRNGADAAGGPRTEAWYDRVFLPQETREVRMYMHGGDDHVRVVGVPAGPITLRVIAGGGDDLLEDLAGDVRFYVERGDNQVVRSRGTRVDARAWHAPTPDEGLRAGSDWAPDFGGDSDFGPSVGYSDRAGPLVGISFGAVRQGFRRLPHLWQLEMRGRYAPRTGGFAGEIEFDRRMLNSRLGLRLDARATTLESFRFHGLGNQTTLAGGRRFDYRQVRVDPAVTWTFGRMPGIEPPAPARPGGADDAAADPEAAPDAESAQRPRLRLHGTVGLGPAVAWTRIRTGSVPVSGDGFDDDVLQFGARATLGLRRVDEHGSPRRGYALRAESAVHPLVEGAGAFGDIEAEGAAYVPLLGEGPHLALRAGGRRVFGEFPAFDAAFVGGRHSLRGALTERWAGDGAAWGSLELRVPVDTITLFARMELGVFAFGDAGRVWHRGATSGGWHTGLGGGAWLSLFGRAASVAIARGEGTRVHAWLGMPF
jgi:hypothetical protein